MKKLHCPFLPQSRCVLVASTLCLVLLPPSESRSETYNWISTNSLSNWTTPGSWSPASGPEGPGAGDDINMLMNGAFTIGVTLAGDRFVNSITKTGTQRWELGGGAATLSTLTVNTINASTSNYIFKDGAGGGGLQVNVGDINVSTGATLYFGPTSVSAVNFVKGLTVSGTTTVTGGTLFVNVRNENASSYSLGLLRVSGTGIVNLNNAPTGKGAVIGQVSGLDGSGGFINVAGAAGQYGNSATLVINNASDYSTATVLREAATVTSGTTLSLVKTGLGTQTLSGANAYTGATTITQGTLRMGSATALGGQIGIAAGNLDNGTNVSGTGTLDLGGQTGVIEVIRLNGNGMGGNGALINSGTAASIGNGVAMIVQTAGGTGPAPTLTLTGGGGDGATATAAMGLTTMSFTVNSGTTVYSVAPTVTISGGGAAVAGTATAILTAGRVTGINLTLSGIGYQSTPTITLTGGTVTTAGTNPTITGNAANFTPISYSVTNTGSGYTSAPEVSYSGGPYAATALLSGIVLEGNSTVGGSGDITVEGLVSETGGAHVLTKAGSHVLTLTNAGNSYTGGTVIHEGTLMVVNEAGSATGSGAVSVMAGTLAGHHGSTGNIAGAVTIGTGGRISPGSAAALPTHGTGRLNLTSLDLQSGSTALFDIEGTADNDRLTISASEGLILNGRITVTTSLTGLDFDNVFADGATFDLLDWAGIVGGSFDVGSNFRDGSEDDASQFDLPNLASLGRVWDVSQFLTSGTLMVSIIPEPSRMLLTGLGLGLVLCSRRRSQPPVAC